MGSTLLRTTNKVSNVLEKAAEIIVSITFTVMVLSILASVLTRNITIPITWLEELARYLQIWTISMGFALALKKGQLAGTELLLKLLNEKAARLVIYLCKIIMLSLSILVMVGGNTIIAHLIKTGQASPIMRIPIVVVYMGIYLGFGFASLFLIISIIKNFFNDEDTLDITFSTTRKETEEMSTQIDISKE